MRLILASALVLAGCAAPSTRMERAEPELRLDLRPEARVLALDLRPAGPAWDACGRLSLPRPVLPGEARLALEGLDAEGRSLWIREADLLLSGGAPRRRVGASFELRLPMDEKLAAVRLSLPSGR